MSNLLSKKTYAPQSVYKDISDFIKPTKGTVIEVLVAWRERILASHHFTRSGTIYLGTHPSCDVIVPLINTSTNRVPLIELGHGAKIIAQPGLHGTIVSNEQSIPFSGAMTFGNTIAIGQGEMARISLGSELEVIVRYSAQAPKPLVTPFIDLQSNGGLAVLMALMTSGMMALYVSLFSPEEPMEEEIVEYPPMFTILNPPKPPPNATPRKTKVKPKKVKTRVSVRQKSPPRKTRSGARGNRNDPRKPKALRKNPAPKKNISGSTIPKGGAKKITAKPTSQSKAATKNKLKKMFIAFGDSGGAKDLSQSYDGSGGLMGVAENYNGKTGQSENRPGNHLGSKFKETGSTGGRSNVGVSGIKGRQGVGFGGGGGLGQSGLGKRKAVAIQPGHGDILVEGQIDREGIRKVFFDNARAIRSCYERALNQNSSLGGKVVLDFDIGQHGRVVGLPRVQYEQSTLKSQAVGDCLVTRLKGWKFPEPPKNQVVNVLYPLIFSAK